MTRDCNFTERSALNLIGIYRDTLGYAGVDKPDSLPPVVPPDGEKKPPRKEAEVGDLVQVEIGGALQLERPKRVRAIQEHQGQRWVFIEGSDTGIPMNQVVLEEKGAGQQSPIVPPPKLPEALVERTLAGEREWLRGPLSRDTSYRLIVSGELGPKEIGKLIKLLQAQQAVLSDDDEAAN